MSRSTRGDRPKTDPAPTSVEEALAQALRHGKNALAEGLLAGRALLDAVSLAAWGRPSGREPGQIPDSEAARALAGLAGGLTSLAQQLRADSPDASPQLTEALLEALDSEIGRWESTARTDPDARAVLRAFLGLRELLWELGMRPAPEAESPQRPAPKATRHPRKRASGKAPKKAKAKPKPTAASRRRRVQRVEIER